MAQHSLKCNCTVHCSYNNTHIILYQEEFTFNILIAKPIFFEMVGVDHFLMEQLKGFEFAKRQFCSLVSK